MVVAFVRYFLQVHVNYTLRLTNLEVEPPMLVFVRVYSHIQSPIIYLFHCCVDSMLLYNVVW